MTDILLMVVREKLKKAAPRMADWYSNRSVKLKTLLQANRPFRTEIASQKASEVKNAVRSPS